MPRHRLTIAEIKLADEILTNIRTQIERHAAENSELLFAYRRRIYKQLEYDERGKPRQRKKLKQLKLIQQKGLCATCGIQLHLKDSELDRIYAPKGYTEQNVQVVCHSCHREEQEQHNFSERPD